MVWGGEFLVWFFFFFFWDRFGVLGCLFDVGFLSWAGRFLF